MQKLLKILTVLTILALALAGVFFYSIYISPERVQLSYTTLSSDKIPEEMDDIRIAFLSDIKYNGFMKKDRLSKMVNELNEAGCDVVIFGGDLFYEANVMIPDSDITKEITDILNSIDAPLGKFAVLGDQDLLDDDTKNTVSSILYQANFEILTNNSVRIRNHTNESIHLIGLDSLINGSPDPTKALKSLNNEEFNIVFTHCPDTISDIDLNSNYLDVMLSGHSLGGQIYLPFLGPLRSYDGAEKYNHGQYHINNTKLFVSNGLGTEGMDMRLFAPPEILIFRLNSTATAK